jgi:uncharacterized membrane protein YbhN (UPF0104 family)
MNRLKVVLRCLLSVALIFLVGRKLDWQQLRSILARVHAGWASIAFLLTGPLIVTLAFRWRIFVKQQRIDLPFGTILSLAWAGQFFNSFLPGSTGGDFFKIYQLCRLAHDRKAAAAATVLADRFSALAALLLLATIAIWIEPGPVNSLIEDGPSGLNYWWLVGLLIAGAAVGFILLRGFKSNVWVIRFGRILSAAREIIGLNGRNAAALSLAFGIHSANFLVVYLFARSLGASITYGQVLLMMPVVLLLVMFPVTINGHGLRELLLIGYFSHLGIRITQRADVGFRELAVALSVLMVANDLIWSLPGGIYYFTRFRLPRQPNLDVVSRRNEVDGDNGCPNA